MAGSGMNYTSSVINNYGQIVIVGAGISGVTLAQKYAEIGKRVVVIEKRDHIGGNCYDYINEDGILVSKYGAHLFHTNYEDVWEYVNRWSDWYFYEHQVKAFIEGKLVPVPVNINTVNMLFGTEIKNEHEMQDWLDQNRIKINDPKNGEEAVLSQVGQVLYEKLFKYYTKKQWNKYPNELNAEVLKRVSVRPNFDNRYFTDKYQYLPLKGYTHIFRKMLDHPNIKVLLNTDFFAIRHKIKNYQKIFYTGPIDRFFDNAYDRLRRLEYRSINFVWETHDKEYYQSNSVVNYTGPTPGFTRIVEYKHFTGQKHPKTAISKEFSVDDGEPYYPVPNSQNQEVFEKYRREAEKLKRIYFVGRLANYKYFNMDQAFKNALDLFYDLEGKSEKIDFYLTGAPLLMSYKTHTWTEWARSNE